LSLVESRFFWQGKRSREEGTYERMGREEEREEGRKEGNKEGRKEGRRQRWKERYIQMMDICNLKETEGDSKMVARGRKQKTCLLK
jgi:hypothetical protein